MDEQMAPVFEPRVLCVVALTVVNVEQVGEDSRQHLARRSGGKMPVLETLVLAAEDFLTVTARQDAAVVERIEKDLAVPRQKVPRKIDALDRHAGMMSD